MSGGDEGRGGGGRNSASSDPTQHDAPASSSTPERVVVRSDPDAADSGSMGVSDTAVASRSQAMVAQGPPADTDPDIGMVGEVLLGRYEVTGKIGQGGMGAVYEARHTLIGKRVAIKVLLDKYATKSPIVARLEQEAKLASSIGHEHIIDITDFGQTEDGRTFVVMEYLEGESLHELVGREGPLPEQRVIRIARQVAGALGAAHDKGIVHRDIKPENVFILRRSDDDFVKVVDFGISKSLRPTEDGSDSPRLTQTGMVLGTPLYMSPEQARGDESLDHRIDIYALGVIMYEMVTGEVPFYGNNYLNIISQVLNDEPASPRRRRPDISEELEGIILRALDKDRDERYQTMKEVAHDLGALQEGGTGTASHARITLSRLRRRSRRRSRRSALRVLAWVAGLAVVAAGVAVTVSVSMSGGGPGEPDQPRSRAAAPPPPDAAPPPDRAPLPPDVEVVEIPIRSTPEGAAIYDGGRLVGRTPTRYRAAKESRHLELTAELEGHETTTIPLNPYLYDPDEDPPVTVRLQEAEEPGPDRPRRPRRRRPPPQPSDDEPAAPDGDEDDTAGGELTGNPYE